MKHGSRFFPVLAGAVAVTGAWGMAAAGCGSSPSSKAVSDAGELDSTTDVQQGEAAVVEDTGSDLNALPDVDSGTGADADAGSAPDGDIGTTDAESTPDIEAGTGLAADAGDASIAVSAQSFPGQVAAAFCNTIAACCGTSADAATFNWQACYASKLTLGYAGSNTDVNFVDGGHVTFNSAQAQTCLSTIAAADCSSNQYTSSEQAQLFQSCFGAYVGTLAVGSPCAGSIECSPGNFCSPVDGGAGDAGAIGSCQPLASVGGSCGFLGNNPTGAQSICSYRGAATNGVFCQNISGDAGFTELTPAAWTCQPQWANGSECYANQDCSSFICHLVGTVGICGTAGNWANTAACAAFVIAVDAGAD